MGGSVLKRTSLAYVLGGILIISAAGGCYLRHAYSREVIFRQIAAGYESLSPGQMLQKGSMFDNTLPHTKRNIGIAFYVQVASTNWKLLPHLLEKIYHPGNVYAVHFDRKMTDADFKSSVALISDYLQPNVVVMDPRDDAEWARMSLLVNLLSGISQLLEFRGAWTHLIFVAPNNYPLLNQENMRELLAQQPRRSFVKGRPCALKAKSMETRTSVLPFDPALYGQEIESKVAFGLPWPAFPPSEILKGSLWNILSKEDCHWITFSPQARSMLVRSRASVGPDEFFFSNLLLERRQVGGPNLYRGYRPLQKSCADNMHYEVWWHPVKKNRSPSHPLFLSSIEFFFQDLSASGAFFARRFDQTPGGLDLQHAIDKNILGNQTFVDLARSRLESACLFNVGEHSCIDDSQS